jgi:hypothetical protein
MPSCAIREAHALQPCRWKAEPSWDFTVRKRGAVRCVRQRPRLENIALPYEDLAVAQKDRFTGSRLIAIFTPHDQRCHLLQPLRDTEFRAGEVLRKLRHSVFTRNPAARNRGCPGDYSASPESRMATTISCTLLSAGPGHPLRRLLDQACGRNY